MAVGIEQGLDRREAARVQRVALRRRQILDAAAHLMQETGYHEVAMQAIAERADVSVGLIYQYFGGKGDVLRALIVDILEDFAAQIPAEIEAAGPDPVARLTVGIQAFCRIIDVKQEATILAYRESRTLGQEGRRQIMALELETSEPIRSAIRDGIASGVFRDVDVDLAAHNVLMIAHGWALKHWHLASRMTAQAYAAAQTDLMLAGLRAS